MIAVGLPAGVENNDESRETSTIWLASPRRTRNRLRVGLRHAQHKFGDEGKVVECSGAFAGLFLLAVSVCARHLSEPAIDAAGAKLPGFINGPREPAP